MYLNDFNSNASSGLLCGIGYRASGMCDGDVGGPLACFDPKSNKSLLAGIISFYTYDLFAGYCVRDGNPMYFTSISHQLAFIKHPGNWTHIGTFRTLLSSATTLLSASTTFLSIAAFEHPDNRFQIEESSGFSQLVTSPTTSASNNISGVENLKHLTYKMLENNGVYGSDRDQSSEHRTRYTKMSCIVFIDTHTSPKA